MAENINSCAAAALSGLARDCATSQGGIKAVWIANYADVETIKVNEAGDKIDGITLVPSKGPEDPIEKKLFKKYNFRKNTGSMSSTLTVDQANGVNYVTTSLVLSFLRMETTKRIEMAALSVNELAIIVEDSNGVYWYLGKDEAVSASAGDGNTGTAKTDGNKYTITLQDDSASFPYEIDPTVMKVYSESGEEPKGILNEK